MNLGERWDQNWQELGLAPKTEVVERLLSSYREAGRFYHTVQHLEECFAYLDRADKAQVRQEYSWVPEKDFCNGRRKVLQQFLQRETIYSTELFRGCLEANPRNNLTRSLKRLGISNAR